MRPNDEGASGDLLLGPESQEELGGRPFRVGLLGRAGEEDVPGLAAEEVHGQWG